VRTDGHKTQVKDLTVKNVTVKNKIEKYVECRIGAARNTVPENFGGDKSQAGKMKKIHHPNNQNPANM
jgi:hypothetical protein